VPLICGIPLWWFWTQHESQTFRESKERFVGTDVTLMVEAQIDGRWVPVVKPIWPNQGFRDRGEEPFGITPYILRDYGLFAVLADVRNKSGRGTITHMTGEVEGIPYEYDYDTDDGGHDHLDQFFEPRGVPADANPAWQEFVKQRKFHDPTWFTLEELENAPYDQVLYEQCVAYEDEYLHWQETGHRPTFAARSAGGPGLEIVNEVEYAAGKRGPKQTAIDFRWRGGTVREEASQAWWATLGIMSMIAPNQDHSRVRMLLVFDS
jgi:hypothetical protein